MPAPCTGFTDSLQLKIASSRTAEAMCVQWKHSYVLQCHCWKSPLYTCSALQWKFHHSTNNWYSFTLIKKESGGGAQTLRLISHSQINSFRYSLWVTKVFFFWSVKMLSVVWPTNIKSTEWKYIMILIRMTCNECPCCILIILTDEGLKMFVVAQFI